MDLFRYEKTGLHWLSNGQITYAVHGPAQCQKTPDANQICSIHNPTNHHMREWPWMLDESRFYMMFRRCPHDHWHPDPDSAQWIRKNLFDYDPSDGIMHHYCCGVCCDGEP